MTKEREYLKRMTIALDGCLPLLEAEAKKEKRREAGKPMREITNQTIYERLTKMVDEVSDYLEESQ